MENKAGIVESLLESIEEYGNTSLNLYKLKAIDRTSEIASTVVSYLAILTCAFLVVVILDIALALWLGQLLGESYYGFLCVAAFNAFLGIVIYGFRYSLIKKPFFNSFIKKMHN